MGFYIYEGDGKFYPLEHGLSVGDILNVVLVGGGGGTRGYCKPNEYARPSIDAEETLTAAKISRTLNTTEAPSNPTVFGKYSIARGGANSFNRFGASTPFSKGGDTRSNPALGGGGGGGWIPGETDWGANGQEPISENGSSNATSGLSFYLFVPSSAGSAGEGMTQSLCMRSFRTKHGGLAGPGRPTPAGSKVKGDDSNQVFRNGGGAGAGYGAGAGSVIFSGSNNHWDSYYAGAGAQGEVVYYTHKITKEDVDNGIDITIGQGGTPYGGFRLKTNISGININDTSNNKYYNSQPDALPILNKYAYPESNRIPTINNRFKIQEGNSLCWIANISTYRRIYDTYVYYIEDVTNPNFVIKSFNLKDVYNSSSYIEFFQKVNGIYMIGTTDGRILHSQNPISGWSVFNVRYINTSGGTANHGYSIGDIMYLNNKYYILAQNTETSYYNYYIWSCDTLDGVYVRHAPQVTYSRGSYVDGCQFEYSDGLWKIYTKFNSGQSYYVYMSAYPSLDTNEGYIGFPIYTGGKDGTFCVIDGYVAILRNDVMNYLEVYQVDCSTKTSTRVFAKALDGTARTIYQTIEKAPNGKWILTPGYTDLLREVGSQYTDIAVFDINTLSGRALNEVYGLYNFIPGFFFYANGVYNILYRGNIFSFDSPETISTTMKINGIGVDENIPSNMRKHDQYHLWGADGCCAVFW